MSSSIRTLKLVLLFLGAVPVSGSAWAQDTQQPQAPEGPARPKPAARGIPGISDQNATAEDHEGQTANWRQDTAPVPGVESPTLGSPELGHMYWVPGLEYGSTIESRPPGQPSSSGWYADNYIGGQGS